MRAHYARGKALVSVADCVDRRRTGLVGVRKRGMALVYGLFARVSDEYSRGLRGLRALYSSVAQDTGTVNTKRRLGLRGRALGTRVDD